MKRFTVAILATIYFIISSGVVMNVHYCMGKVSSVKMSVLAENLCACGSKKDSKGCCKTEHKIIKIQDDQKSTVSEYSVYTPLAIFIPQQYFISNTPLQIVAVSIFSNHSPPLLSHQDIYLRNNVFRI